MSDDVKPEWLRDLTVLTLKPGDKIVLRHPFRLSHSGIEQIKAAFAETCPGHQVIVIHEGAELGVLRAEP